MVGGRTDLFLTRFIDVMYAFPRLLFVILVMSMLGAGLMNIFIAIGLTGWVGIARQTRAQVLAIREKESVDAARGLGAGFSRLLAARPAQRAHADRRRRHLRHPGGDLHRGGAVVHRRRHQPADPSWGQMVGEGQQYIRSYWHLCVFPSIAIAVTMLAFTFFGDGVRDALDPKMK